MSWDTEVLRVLKKWDAHQEWLGSGYGVTSSTLEQMALIAAQALLPLCGAEHPHRPSILCTERETHVGLSSHGNNDLGLSWVDDGTTWHSQFGEIVLVSEPSRVQVVPDTQDDATEDGSGDAAADVVTQDAEDLLRGVAKALSLVNEAYRGDSKRLTAFIYRATRDAEKQVAAVLNAAESAVARG